MFYPILFTLTTLNFYQENIPHKPSRHRRLLAALRLHVTHRQARALASLRVPASLPGAK